MYIKITAADVKIVFHVCPTDFVPLYVYRSS